MSAESLAEIFAPALENECRRFPQQATHLRALADAGSALPRLLLWPSAQSRQTLAQVAAALSGRRCVALAKDPAHLCELEELLAGGAGLAAQTRLLLRTSGTSGVPRWVQVSEEMIRLNIRRGQELYRWTQSDPRATYLHLSFAHSGGLLLQALPAFAARARLRVAAFSVTELAECAGGEGLKTTILLPGQVQSLLRSRCAGDASLFAGCDSLLTGSQRIDPWVFAALFERGAKRVDNVYGATEFGPYAWVRSHTTTPTEEAARELGVRHPSLDYQVSETGELHVRGEFVTTGRISEGPQEWLATGDVVRANSGGLVFEGKCEHMVRPHGTTINLEALEAKLIQALALSEVAILRRPAEFVVVLAAPLALRGRLLVDVRRLMPRELGYYRIAFVDAWLRNANGKVDRQALLRAAG